MRGYGFNESIFVAASTALLREDEPPGMSFKALELLPESVPWATTITGLGELLAGNDKLADRRLVVAGLAGGSMVAAVQRGGRRTVDLRIHDMIFDVPRVIDLLTSAGNEQGAVYVAMSLKPQLDEAVANPKSSIYGKAINRATDSFEKALRLTS
jgi:hypothetical protein